MKSLKEIYLFKVESRFSSREIIARTKKEARKMFLLQVPTARGEKLSVK
jgi:hypothetical protein